MSQHPQSSAEVSSSSIPHAPYPPILSPRYPSTQLSSLRSSLSSTPHYKSSIGTLVVGDGSPAPGAVNGAPAFDQDELGRGSDHEATNGRVAVAPQACRIEFCGRDLLASINCLHDSSFSPTHQYQGSVSADEQDVFEGAAFGGGISAVGRKRGSVLLELRRLKVNKQATGGELFSTAPVSVSRSNPSLGTSLSSTCLQVAPSSAIQPYRDQTIPPPCATGLTTGALCLHTFQNTSLEAGSFDNQDYSSYCSSSWTPSIEYYHTPRYHRPATAVAWRPVYPCQVAIGLVASSSMQNAPASVGGARRGAGGVAAGVGLGGVGSGAGGRSAGTGDREHCCFIWDVEHQSGSSGGGGGGSGGRRTKSTPLFKLSHQVGVASLGWLLEGGQTLAVGGQQRNLQLYDLRVKGTGPQQAPVSVYAHNFGVDGIEPDPYRPWQFLTYCRAANEPVKLWDSRRMDSVLSEIKVSGSTKSGDSSTSNFFGANTLDFSSTTVSSVKWSTTEPGKMVVAVGDAIHEYDTSTSASRPIHINTVYAREPVLDIALYPYSNTPTELQLQQQQQQQPETDRTLDEIVIAEYSPRRMVTVHVDRTVRDMARHTLAPVAISPRDGRVVHAFGRFLWVGETNKGPSAMESLQIDEINEDVSATMMRRARCQILSKYSMDTASNIKIIAEDGIQVEGSRKESLRPQREALLRLWSWIERVESLCSESSEELWAPDGVSNVSNLSWHAKGLIDAGAWRLLRIDDGVEDDEEVFSGSLCCMTYASPGRRAALTSCGWAGRFDLVNILAECEDLGEFERSAALAVWHGDIGAAVEALERGAAYIRGRLSDIKRNKKQQDPHISPEYAETLELVSLSVAGYRGGDSTSAASGIWRRACAKLLQRAANLFGDCGGGRVAYIRSVLKFLITLGTENGHQEEVIGDASLCLCDRVGFACRFLPRDELYTFTEKCVKACQASGDCEGVTITGIEKEGIRILQSYVDRYADVQTAALVTSRVILPMDWTTERSICLEWVDCYRTLLNSWQMWQSRAMFDVDRAELLRKVKLKHQQQTSGSMSEINVNKTVSNSSSSSNLSRQRLTSASRKPSGLRQPDPDIQVSLPTQLEARCNYCSSLLGLKNQDTKANLWLSKMKPVLSCCPQCRKPLPRCAICMLSLGALNPYMELTKERSRLPQRSGSGSGSNTPQQPPDDLSSLASLPFAEWFTWCMRCKHGGHAHHMVGWFAKYQVCPVSGCDCQCQFDGIQKLNRPALVAD